MLIACSVWSQFLANKSKRDFCLSGPAPWKLVLGGGGLLWSTLVSLEGSSCCIHAADVSEMVSHKSPFQGPPQKSNTPRYTV
jgi:hypothetical protein